MDLKLLQNIINGVLDYNPDAAFAYVKIWGIKHAITGLQIEDGQVMFIAQEVKEGAE